MGAASRASLTWTSSNSPPENQVPPGLYLPEEHSPESQQPYVHVVSLEQRKQWGARRTEFLGDERRPPTQYARQHEDREAERGSTPGHGEWSEGQPDRKQPAVGKLVEVGQQTRSRHDPHHEEWRNDGGYRDQDEALYRIDPEDLP